LSLARAALMTGRYPLTLGMQYYVIEGTTKWNLNESEILLPQILKEKGNYGTYAIGKWHLGHYQPQLLPTARGFDQFIGYVDGSAYYWTKQDPVWEYQDLLYADEHCYYVYNETDKTDYSTFFYTSKAISVIENHDFTRQPMFLYMAYQAVHIPFYDPTNVDGLTSTYFAEDLYNTIANNTVGDASRLQYALALKLMDESFNQIVQALKEEGEYNNTYFFFMGDNGGCIEAGGRNGYLRGNKGNLFEGGTHVDAFLYSEMFSSTIRGSNYSHLMHVTDLFPTMIDLVGIDYQPSSNHSFDGVSHWSALHQETSTIITRTTTVPPPPRTNMVYNIFTNVNGKAFNVSTNAPFAVRNTQYKLVHEYVGNILTEWYDPATVWDDDNLHNDGTCSQSDALSGNYSKLLFDLINDPYEKTNLYDDASYTSIKVNLIFIYFILFIIFKIVLFEIENIFFFLNDRRSCIN
jgi:arylsulfatase A-like enzyme